MAAKELNVRERAIKSALEKAAEARKVSPGSAKAMQLAVFRWFADEMGLTKPEDKESRQALWEAWRAQPVWFGSNASQGAQRLGFRSETSEFVEDVEA